MSQPSKNKDKTVPISKNGRFVKGNPGGPGRPQGSRNRATILARSLMAGALPEIIQDVIKQAKEGDFAAQKLLIERLVPVPKDNVIRADFGELNNIDDLPEAAGRIIKAVGDSEITPSEALTMSRLLVNHVKLIELSEMDKRLTALENGREPD